MNDLEKDFLELFQTIFRAYGLSALCVKVTALLYLEPEDVSMEDLAKKTGYSLASISNTMKLLENLGMVKRVKKPKTKKVFFFMEKNLVKLNIDKLRSAYENTIKPVKEHVPQIVEKYKNKVKSERDKRKLQIIEDYYKQIIKFENILNNWIKDLTKIESNLK